MAENNGSNLKDWLIIAAVFGPDAAIKIYNVVIWGSVFAFILALAGCFG